MEYDKVDDVLVIKFSQAEITDPACVRKVFEQSVLEKKEKKLVVDLSAVESLDSTGIGLLVSGHVLACIEQAKLVVAGAKDRIRELLKMTNLDTLLTLRPTVAEAVKAF